VIRKIRTLENYLGTISKIRYGTANYVVGSGHRPIPSTDSDEFNKLVLKEWKKWAENPKMCDRTGKNTVYDMQHLCASGEMGDGEAFLITQKTRSGYPQLLMVDPLLVDNPIHKESTGIIRDGVKLDGAGKILGYWVKSYGDESNPFLTTSKFVPSNQIFHYCNFKRTELVRGMSPLHSAANHFHDIIDLISLEISATKTHQAMAIHVKKTKGSTLSLEDQFDDVDKAIEESISEETGNASQYEKEDGLSKVHGASLIDDDGIDEVNLLTSDRPNQSLKEFFHLILQECANSTEFSYEFFYNMANLGGASARYSVADAYAVIQAKQQRMTRQVNYPIYRWWLASMIKRGTFDGVEIPEHWWECKWEYPPKITLDIKHDGKNLIELLSNGLTSETEIFEATGKSRQEHVHRRVRELREVLDACEQEGIPFELYYQQFYAQAKKKEDQQKLEKPNP
jgi:capsid protein